MLGQPATDSGDRPVPQPFLHHLLTCVRSPSSLACRPSGQLHQGGVEGWLRHDVRQLSELVVEVSRGDDVAGEEPEAVGAQLGAAWSAHFVGVCRSVGDPISDPTVRVERERSLDADRLVERVALVNDGRADQQVSLRVRVGADHLAVQQLRAGRSAGPAVAIGVTTDEVAWSSAGAVTSLRCSPVPDEVTRLEGHAVELRWRLGLAARTTESVELVATATDIVAPVLGPAELRLSAVVTSRRAALDRLAARSLADLSGLATVYRDHPDDVFAAAGSPWYLTLFGRDSIWAARMTLPLGTDLALGTLRTLARHQGRRTDPVTAEQPGKMLHELRSGPDLEGLGLPPVYFGTVDATPLWISLLHDAWRWGLPEADVRALRPHLDRALDWVLRHADADGDGLVEYLDEGGAGLTNQGWKDSEDAVLHPDGRLAAAPIALCEAQAYVVRACLDAAALIEALDGATEAAQRTDELRAHAGAVAERFRAKFWVEDAGGRFPAIALDGSKAPVGSATSNLGHLLATGLLQREEEAAVAARIAAPDLDSGHGLRTLSAEHPAFNRIGYHTGSVWPHDTAIAVLALARAGHDAASASLATGLLDIADGFEGRLPELFGGTDRAEPVIAYPAACRPQAWSAAAVVPLLQSALGLEADVPQGTLTVAPRLAFATWFPLEVRGLRVAGRTVDVRVDADGTATVSGADDLTVRQG